MFLTLIYVIQAAGRLKFEAKGVFWLQLGPVFVAAVEFFQVQRKKIKVCHLFFSETCHIALEHTQSNSHGLGVSQSVVLTAKSVAQDAV